MDALRLDPVLLLLVMILGLFRQHGLYSASGRRCRVMRQVTRSLVAKMLLVAAANIPLRMVRKMSIWLYLGGVALLVAVMLFGEVGKGAQRWLDLGFVRFQPSEWLRQARGADDRRHLSRPTACCRLGLKELIVSRC